MDSRVCEKRDHCSPRSVVSKVAPNPARGDDVSKKKSQLRPKKITLDLNAFGGINIGFSPFFHLRNEVK